METEELHSCVEENGRTGEQESWTIEYVEVEGEALVMRVSSFEGTILEFVIRRTIKKASAAERHGGLYASLGVMLHDDDSRLLNVFPEYVR